MTEFQVLYGRDNALSLSYAISETPLTLEQKPSIIGLGLNLQNNFYLLAVAPHGNCQIL